MKTHIGVLWAGVFALGLAGSAQAALESRLGGQAVYDTILDITWTADANLAATNSFGLQLGGGLGTHPSDNSPTPAGGVIMPDGRMNWPGALFWIDAMNGASYLGVSDWRLPTALNQDGTGPCGPAFSCTGSEMGHMFYNNLSGTAGFSVLNSSDPDLALFSNLQSNGYWSETESAADLTRAWVFPFHNGRQTTLLKDGRGGMIFAWAVRPGDIAAVPEPTSLVFVGTVLGGLLGVGWRRRR